MLAMSGLHGINGNVFFFQKVSFQDVCLKNGLIMYTERN